MSEFIISSSPHIKSKITTKYLMNSAIIALLPALVVAIVMFGYQYVLPVVLLSVISAVLSEALFQKLFGLKLTFLDGSAALTGLLLALCLPPRVPLWIPVLGSIFAMFSKQVFGGLGQNIFNPALMGRAFLLLSWPGIMTKWYAPFAGADAVTTATPLNIYKFEGLEKLISLFGGDIFSTYKHLFLGLKGGSIGEVFIPALLLGLIYLLIKGVISWHIPVSYIVSCLVFSYLFGLNPIITILTGGILFGAFFMATDYVTSPLLTQSKLIYGFSIGFLNIIIRKFGGMPEGVTFAILIMNMIVPLLDKQIRKPFGFIKEKKVQSEK